VIQDRWEGYFTLSAATGRRRPRHAHPSGSPLRG
jgi:hypothetical protein